MDKDKKNGPEWAPIREYIKSFIIIVTFYDKNDRIVRQEELDYGKSEDRAWLGRLSFWGWSNGYYIETARKV